MAEIRFLSAPIAHHLTRIFFDSSFSTPISLESIISFFDFSNTT